LETGESFQEFDFYVTRLKRIRLEYSQKKTVIQFELWL